MSPLPNVWRPQDQKDFAGPALLDTHIWIWYLDGIERNLGRDLVSLLRRCEGEAGLLVSDISVWEIGNKVSKKALSFVPSLSRWLELARLRPGFSFFSLEADVLLYSTHLPGVIHGDPADRILVASAAIAGIPLVTVDRLIIEYAEVCGGISVCDARH